MKLKQFIFALVAMLSSFAFTANAQTAVSSFDDLKAALASSTDIVVNGDIAVDEAITIPSGTTVAGDGTLHVQTKVYVVSTETSYPGVTYNKTATKNGSINGTVSCGVVYEISLDGGDSWFTDTTNGKAQAVTVKKDGTKTISTSFQSAFTSAKCGEIVHMLKDAHVQSTNSKKNNGPLRSYYGLILEGNGHTIYTDVESSGASNEYSTIKFTSYLAGTGDDVRPVLKNVTIDSQKNAKADIDIVSGDVTFTVSLFNVNLLGKCVYASFPLTSPSLVLNKSNVKLFDSSIPAWDAGSANAIEFYSGDYSLSFNNKCQVYGGTFSKNAANFLVERAEISNVNGKYVVTCKEEKAEVAPSVNTTVDSEVAKELVANEAVANNSVELPADVADFTVQLTAVESDNEVTTKVTYTVTPSNVIGEKVSTPSEAITFRLPVPAAWSGKANVYHEGTLLGAYTIEDENGAKFVEVSSANFSEFTVEPVAPVVDVNGTKYASFADAAAAAQAGDEIKLLANIDGDITVPAGVIFNGNGFAVSGAVTAAGEITFKNVTKVGNFGVQYVNTTVNIPAGASLQLTGTGRMVIGHGCTFNITGSIADAKAANVADVTPSLVMPGASFTGAGVTFNVTNAYIKATAYCSSKNSSASGTHNFNITNSIWEQTGSFVFTEPTNGMDPTFNLNFKDGVLNSTSHLVFAVTKGEIVFDNSNVNGEDARRQIENRSKLTVKNGSVVYGSVATSSNAKNPGTLTVDNATYNVKGEFSGSDLGTGTLIINKGATVSVGSITKANIQIDATDMAAGDEINFTGNLSKLAGTIEVINNDKLEAKIVDGKIVLAAKPVAKIGEQGYATLEAAFAAATEGQTIAMLDDATPALTSQRAITKAAVIDLGGKTMTLTEDDLYFGTTTFKNGTIVVDPSVKPSTAVFWMFANQTLTFDAVKVVATGVTGTYLIGLDGNNSDLNLLNGSEILVENTTALDLDIICVNASTGNDIKVENSKVNVTNLDGRVFFRGNYTVKDSEVNLAGITKAGFRIEAGQTLSIEGTSVVNIEGEPRDGGIHMTDLTATYTKAESATVNATVNEPKVAKVGENTYRTLAQAVAAVEDGGTITLIANETFTKNNRYNNGGWWDGLGYSGDKSFTIDLANFTISQDGALNDYLMWFKNDGAKANTITLKNGTLDAGTTAFCAIATASSNVQKITVNLENINLINNNSNGSTIKLRGGAVLNVNDGTKITGKNSYLGIECVASTVNIYDGAEIYMNGTTSYNGCLVGACGGGTVNVYGGYGKGAKGGFIAMTSGGTINISGGEWIANTNGTVGNNSNVYVLTAQSNKNEQGFVGPAIINVTGGTFRGGMDAWVLNNHKDEKAELNISGGNFNANPTSYVAEDYIAVENNGVWNVVKAAAKIDKQGYATIKEAVAAVKESETITILAGTHSEGTIKLPATLKNVTIKGAASVARSTEETILKDMKITSADGNSINYEGLKFDGITFDNSNVVLTGWRNNGAVYKNIAVNGCTFKNLSAANTEAAFHINCGATEAVNGFTFTNNVIDNLTGGSKSGIYAQVTGEVKVENNVINNVQFRPYVIQVTTDDGIADNFTVKGNTFSGSAAGRAQGLGNNAEGTDNVNIVVSNNIFKGITDSQQICYWNFNTATTTADLSKNYYDINIEANPGKIYFNSAAADNFALRDMNVFPIYTALNEDGTINTESAYTPKFYIAKVGENSYEAISDAVAAAQAGDEIVLIADVKTTDGVVITDKNLTIDLNGKTYTVTQGANTNNRNFKINGTSVVTVKNGTMVAAGDYSSGAYGTIRTEGTANVTLTGLKLYNYRGNGLNIKAYAGTTVTIENTEIYANYGGGIEAAGGTIVVNDGVTVEQKGMYTAPYNSMAISVNGGGKVTVNGGTFSTECITAEEANNQGTSHGPWVAGVLNSGGTLIINGGTFSNDNFGENSLATAARGAILADTKAKVEIYGGEFNVLKNVIDIQNNLGDANNNPSVVLAGGTYNADPRISAQYGSNLITLAEDYIAVENNGVWNVVKAAAKIGEQGYTSFQAAVNAVQNGETITLLADVAENVTLTEKTGLYYTIDGDGKTMTGTITVSSLSDTNDNRRITIKNINFVDTENGRDFITSTATNHYPRLTVESCSFTGTGKEAANSVAIRLKSSHSVVIKDCTGTGLHSFLQNTSGWNLTIENVKVTDSKSAFALGTVQGVTVKGVNVDVLGYGIRMDAGYNNNAVIESDTIKAFIPVVVRKATVDSNITVKGKNEFTASNTDGLWCAIGTSEYEANGEMPTAATGRVKVSLNDNLDAEGVYGNFVPVAKIGDVYYATLAEAIAASTPETGFGGEVTLLKDVTLEGGYADATEGLRIEKSVTINGGGYTIDCGTFTKGIRIYQNGDKASNVMFKNINIVNNNAQGRCIDTRSGKINLQLNGGVNLTAHGTNSQPLTIGGSEAMTKVSISGGTIDAGTSGYAVICFVPVTNHINVQGNAVIKGLAAFYLKEGVTKTAIKLSQSTSIGTNKYAAASGDFGAIVIEGSNNAVRLEHSDAVVKAVAADGAEMAAQAAFLLRGNNNTVGYYANANAKVVTEGGQAYWTLSHADVTGTKYERNGVEMLLEAETGGYQFITVEDALRYAQDGSTVKLLANVDLTSTTTISKAITLDGNNHKLTVSGNGVNALTVSAAKDKTVTFKNLEVACTGYGAGSITAGIYNTGKNNLVLDNVNVLSSNYAIFSSTDNIVVNNSTLKGDMYVIYSSVEADIQLNGSTLEKTKNYGAGSAIYVQKSGSKLDIVNSTITAYAPQANIVAAIEIGDNNVEMNIDNNSTITIEGNNVYVVYVGDKMYNSKKITSGNYNIAAGATINKPNAMLPTIFIKDSKVQLVKDNVAPVMSFTLQDAVNDVEVDQTVQLIDNLELSEFVTVASSKNVTLDLNGKTLSTAYVAGSTTNHLYAIHNYGELTITDSSDAEAGKISARGNFNYGTLTLEAGTIEAIDGNGGYAVRNYDGATFTMNGGTIATTLEDDHQVNNGGYDATTVRVDEGATFIMNGGELNNICDYTFAIDNNGTTTVKGGKATSVHTTVANYGTINIEGGEFVCNGLDGITAHAVWAAEGTTNISGGTFDGKDNYNGFNVCAEAGAVVNITGGTFLPVHSGSLYGNGTITVSAGTFFDKIDDARCAVGYQAVANENGTYTVEYTGKRAEVTIVDGEVTEFVNAKELSVGKLTYKRTVGTTWTPLYVPFEIPAKVLLNAGFEVGYITGVREADKNNDGEIDDLAMEIIQIKNTSAILKANHPYFIRSIDERKALEIVLENAKLYSAAELSYDCRTMYTEYLITGNYSRRAGFTSDDRGISAGNWEPFVDEYEELNPFRFYLTIKSRENSPFDVLAVKSMGVVVRGEESEDGTTVIYDVYDENAEDMIFDLQGRRVLETEKGGIYIKGGKKFIAQ